MTNLVVKRNPLVELIDELGEPEVVVEFNNWLPVKEEHDGSNE